MDEILTNALREPVLRGIMEQRRVGRYPDGSVITMRRLGDWWAMLSLPEAQEIDRQRRINNLRHLEMG